MSVLPWLERTVASWLLTTLQALSRFSVITIFILRYGNTSTPADTGAQGSFEMGVWPAKRQSTTTLLTLCAAALDTVMMTVSLVFWKVWNNWSSSSRREGHNTKDCCNSLLLLDRLEIPQDIEKIGVVLVKHSELLIKGVLHRIFLAKGVVIENGPGG